MSRLIARILLSLFVFPLGVFTYVGVIMINEWQRSYAYVQNRETREMFFAGLITWAVVGAYWVGIWFANIRWTNERRILTVVAVLGALLLAGGIGGIVYKASNESPLGMLFGSILAPLLWLFATVFIWQENAAERGARINNATGDALTCPVCGYNLTGLSEPRCPECGTKFTLTDLFARQPSRASAAQDREVAG